MQMNGLPHQMQFIQCTDCILIRDAHRRNRAHSRTKQFPVIQFDNIELDSAFRVIHAIKWLLNTLVVNGRLPRWSEYISDRFHWISQQNNKQPNEQQKIGFVFLSTHFHDEIVQQVVVYIHHWTLLMWMLQVSKWKFYCYLARWWWSVRSLTLSKCNCRTQWQVQKYFRLHLYSQILHCCYSLRCSLPNPVDFCIRLYGIYFFRFLLLLFRLSWAAQNWCDSLSMVNQLLWREKEREGEKRCRRRRLDSFKW